MSDEQWDSDDSSYITGQVIWVDGGLTLGA
jgi:NAD(P)-dependent dehydrogenase (short-subunit alcohol dehydrogenase family)